MGKGIFIKSIIIRIVNNFIKAYITRYMKYEGKY